MTIGSLVTTPMTRTRTVLHGWPDYATDMAKQLIALTVACTIVFLAVSGWSLFTGSFEEFVGMLRLIAVMAVATLFGHGLVTRIRGHVSLIASGFFTWASLVAVFSLLMLGADRETFVANFWLSFLVSIPIIALMTVLRAFVPPFQVKTKDGRLRPRMSSEA